MCTGCANQQKSYPFVVGVSQPPPQPAQTPRSSPCHLPAVNLPSCPACATICLPQPNVHSSSCFVDHTVVHLLPYGSAENQFGQKAGWVISPWVTRGPGEACTSFLPQYVENQTSVITVEYASRRVSRISAGPDSPSKQRQHTNISIAKFKNKRTAGIARQVVSGRIHAHIRKEIHGEHDVTDRYQMDHGGRTVQ